MLVTARNDSTLANWAIHANMDTDMFDQVPEALNPSTSAHSSVLPLLLLPSSLLLPYFKKQEQRTDVPNPTDATASITYDASSSAVTDLGFIDAYADVPDIEIVPVDAVPAPAVVRTIELEVSFDTMDDGTNHAMFNGVRASSSIPFEIEESLTTVGGGGAGDVQLAQRPRCVLGADARREREHRGGVWTAEFRAGPFRCR